MKLLIDDANIEKIKEIMEIYPLDGATTNPSILSHEKEQPYAVLRALRSLLGTQRDLHVQVISRDAQGIMREAKRIQSELGSETYVKIPVTEQGLKAIGELSRAGVRVTATAIYTKMQAYLAAKAGALYAAPYVNRIDNLGADGVATVADIERIFKNGGYACQVVAASFKNSQQVMDLCCRGIDAVTVSPDVLRNMMKNDAVTAAVSAFTKDFEGLCGAGKTMETCE